MLARRAVLAGHRQDGRITVTSFMSRFLSRPQSPVSQINGRQADSGGASTRGEDPQYEISAASHTAHLMSSYRWQAEPSQ
jgi:hypothetical protein